MTKGEKEKLEDALLFIKNDWIDAVEEYYNTHIDDVTMGELNDMGNNLIKLGDRFLFFITHHMEVKS